MDFTLTEPLGWVEKVGYYSQCVPHEATREEVLLWRRVQKLGQLLAAARPPEAPELVWKIQEMGPTSRHLTLNAEDFARLRQHAQDVIDLVNDPVLVRQGILGSFDSFLDGAATTTWLKVSRETPSGILVQGQS